MRIGNTQRIRLRQKLSRELVVGLISSIFIFAAFFIYSNLFNNKAAYAAVNYTWNGSADSLWSNSSNWTPSGTPTPGDNVIIGTVATRTPVLSDTISITNLTINNGGFLNLNGFSLTCQGTTTINNGAKIDLATAALIMNGNAVLNGGLFLDTRLDSIAGAIGTVAALGSTTTFGLGATGPVFEGNVKVNSATVRMMNSTFNAIASIYKTGTSNDQSSGNNTFNGLTYITTTSTGYFLMSSSKSDTFNAEVNFNSQGSGIIYPAYSGTGTLFNQNVIVSSSSTGGVRIGANTGVATLADTKSILIGSEGFTSGMLMLGRINILNTDSFKLTLPGSAVLTVSGGATFNGDVFVDCGGICFSGATFNKTATFIKNGSTSDRGTGANIFNSKVSITNNGTGYILMSNNNADIFNDEVTFSCTNTGIIYPAYAGTGTQFNENVIVNSSGSGGVRIGASTGSSMIAIGKRIIIGSDGFSTGNLTLGNFTSADTASQTFSLSGNAILTLGPNSEFAGEINAEAGGISLNGVTFNGPSNFIKNGTSSDQGTGNNIFNAPVSFTNNGTGYMLLCNTKNDVYNAEVTFTCNSSGIIYPAYRGTQTLFNDNVIINSTGSGGVRIGASTGSSELAVGKRIIVGSDGFSNGMLTLGNFTSSDTAQTSIALTGSSIITLGPSTTFAGKFTAEAGGICLNGTTFNGATNLIKNGSTSDQGTGNNIFNAPVSIINNGTGYCLLSNTTRDIYNDTVTYTCTNSGIIYPAYRGTNTEFNADIIVNSTGTGGVRIGASTGTSTLADSKKIIIGSEGFSNGTLMLGNFNSLNTNPQSLELTGNGILSLGPASTFEGDIISNTGGLCFNGATFNGIANFTKNGASNDQGIGNNIFNKLTTITNNGTGYILMSSSKKDIFNADVNFTITSSGIIYPGYTGIGNEFNENITVSSSGNGSIRFGQSAGTSVLADGKTISIGSGGFSSGFLQIGKFTQLGNTRQSMEITSGTAAIYFNSGTTFNGETNFRFPQVYLNGSTFNNTSYIEKNGATNNAGTGLNIFNAPATIKNSGTGIFYLANSSGDDFNEDVTFIQNGTGALRPAHNGVSTFAKNISTIGSTAVITFAASNGTVAFDGTAAQSISGSPVYAPIMRRMNVSNASGGLTLNVPVTVNVALTLNSGLVYTTNTNLLIIDNGVSSVSGVSNASYVEGPVRKVGTQAFTFPVGKNGKYRPIGMSAPTGATSHFTAEYKNSDPGLLYSILSLVLSLKQVSRCEYWTLQRTNGSANVSVSLSWDASSCAVGSPADLKVTSWFPLLSVWQDLGSGSFSGSSAAGTIVSNSAVSNFGVFTLASTNANVTLPVELMNFDALIVNDNTQIDWKTASEINNDYFTIERSADGEYFESIGTVAGVGNTTNLSTYQFIDESPFSGTSFYRLRQTDYDGQFKVYDPVSVNYKGANMDFVIKAVGPNPFSDILRIDYFSPDNSQLLLILSGLDGSIALQENINVNAGSGTYTTGQLPQLASGVYILKLAKGEAVLESRKLVRK